MALAAEKELAHIGETKCMADHDHDLVHELSKRLDSIWRYDQYIANAEGHEELQSLWRDCKREDLAMVDRLREMIAAEIRQGCF